jgi:hypothetical protein
MQQNNAKKQSDGAGSRSFFGRFKDKKQLWALGGVLLVIILIAWAGMFSSRSTPRAESYKKITGSAAGLKASISYGCTAQSCFDFNVYVYKDNGQEISVIRPDKDGKVNAAFPEGNYVLLIGKQFGKDDLFPQETVMLKNGQELELKLHYE